MRLAERETRGAGAMNLERLEEMLSQLDGDPKRWPAAERAEAAALIATEPQAANLHNQALRLDRLLGAAMAPVAMDAAAMGRIIAGIDRRRHRDQTLQPTRRPFAWASVATVVVLVAGFATGVAIPSNQGEDTLAGLMFGGSGTSATDSGSVL
jgi:anti-sigma factor RsiW